MDHQRPLPNRSANRASVTPKPNNWHPNSMLPPQSQRRSSSAYLAPPTPTRRTLVATPRASSYHIYPSRRSSVVNSSRRVSAAQPTPRRNVSNESYNSTSSASTIMADFEGPIVEVGDIVAVPGGMTGAVKFVGNVRGKKGLFAGVELSREYAPRGKNDGDVDGVQYFVTSVPGAGIFLPAHRPVRVSTGSPSVDHFPATPTTPGQSLRASSQSPQTPMSKLGPGMRSTQRPNFSQSVGPGARAPSPQQKAIKSRPSLPRPESPVRKQPSFSNVQTPGRASTGTASGLSASVRGGRPSGISPGPRAGFGIPKTPGGMRSPSRSNSRTQDRSPEQDSTPTNFSRTMPNGAVRPRAPSRAQSNTTTSVLSDRPSSADAEENARLKRNLDERDKQLKEQALSLADMESSLAELQAMVADTALQPQVPTPNGEEPMSNDMAQLRLLLRDKTDKIASLTAEFDNHRADFRSTIDTLEMASTETERVYEDRVQELLAEVKELQERQSDVDGFAGELKRLEDFVMELETGLEDARRGEAEARSEVEFLRGEVERGRIELRREREKSAKALKGATGAVNEADAPTNGSSREMAARDDEIRGLKAIIHSLSSGPDAASSPATSNRNTLTSNTSNSSDRDELARLRSSLDTLAREKNDLRGLIERKNFREEELERELASFRRSSATPQSDQTTPRKHADSTASAKTAIRPGTAHRDAPPPDVSQAEKERLGLPAFPSPPDGAAAAGALGAGRTGFSRGMGAPPSPRGSFEDASESVAPLTVTKSPTTPPAAESHANGNGHPHGHEGGIMAQLTGEGPVAGKASGKVDMGKWCALCERDGHDSVDCPLEDEF